MGKDYELVLETKWEGIVCKADLLPGSKVIKRLNIELADAMKDYNKAVH